MPDVRRHNRFRRGNCDGEYVATNELKVATAIVGIVTLLTTAEAQPRGQIRGDTIALAQDVVVVFSQVCSAATIK